MQGFVLSRHSEDAEQGINLTYWLTTEDGPVCLRQTQQEAVCFLSMSQQHQAQKLMQSMGLPASVWLVVCCVMLEFSSWSKIFSRKNAT